jgi:hypothetical protein
MLLAVCTTLMWSMFGGGRRPLTTKSDGKEVALLYLPERFSGVEALIAVRSENIVGKALHIKGFSLVFTATTAVGRDALMDAQQDMRQRKGWFDSPSEPIRALAQWGLEGEDPSSITVELDTGSITEAVHVFTEAMVIVDNLLKSTTDAACSSFREKVRRVAEDTLDEMSHIDRPLFNLCMQAVGLGRIQTVVDTTTDRAGVAIAPVTRLTALVPFPFNTNGNSALSLSMLLSASAPEECEEAFMLTLKEAIHTSVNYSQEAETTP